VGRREREGDRESSLVRAGVRVHLIERGKREGGRRKKK
jgi:hypothetical protein